MTNRELVIYCIMRRCAHSFEDQAAGMQKKQGRTIGLLECAETLNVVSQVRKLWDGHGKSSCTPACTCHVT
jgi:hypothetical protein